MTYIIILSIILLCSAFAVAFESKAIIKQNEKMLLVAPISLFILGIILTIMFFIHKAFVPEMLTEQIAYIFTDMLFVIDFVMVGIQFLLMLCCTITEKKKIQKNRVKK